MSDKVKKSPYTIEASNIGFDITKPQPQLFVTPNFAHLSFVLEEFANKMALRKGGLTGVKKLIDSNDLGTIELSTGIQISGKFSRVISNDAQRVVYINTIGPTALAYKNKELIGHDKEYHCDGFGSPIGKLKGINIAIEDMSPTDLEAYGIYEGKRCNLNFEGGINVTGEIITGKRNLQGKIILISFKNCTVKKDDEILFDPSWGNYDMAVGANIVSAFSGIADPNSYGLIFDPPKERTHKIEYSDKEKELHSLYNEVRQIRNSKKKEVLKLKSIFEKLKNSFQEDWLLALELYEIIYTYETEKDLANNVLDYLNDLTRENKIKHLIKNGLAKISLNK